MRAFSRPNIVPFFTLDLGDVWKVDNPDSRSTMPVLGQRAETAVIPPHSGLVSTKYNCSQQISAFQIIFVVSFLKSFDEVNR